MKVSFGALVNDMSRLNMVLKQSELDPELSFHILTDPTSATVGLNKLLYMIEQDGSDIAILTHQDMFYRNGWLKSVEEQISLLPDSWIVVGIIGKDMGGNICGKFHDMRIPPCFNTKDIHTFPQPASCFDECCIIVNMKTGFRFDEEHIGFDLYGTLAVCQAWEMGGTAWIIDAFAEHYCMRPFTWHPDESFEEMFKWLHGRFPYAQRIDSTVIAVDAANPPRYDHEPKEEELLTRKPEYGELVIKEPEYEETGALIINTLSDRGAYGFQPLNQKTDIGGF